MLIVSEKEEITFPYSGAIFFLQAFLVTPDGREMMFLLRCTYQKYLSVCHT